MVKKQKEKQYQSAREHKRNSQIRSGSGSVGGIVQRKLPFACCALTLTPFKSPVCVSGSGIVFDNAALLEFLMKHKKDPVTGKDITTRDVITLHMDQDEEGRWQCPIITKPFADHTKIVAVVDNKTKEAYVYSYEAYKELNVTPKNWLDLTTGKKFSPKDVLILNDPQDEEFAKQRNIQNFWHIQHARNDTNTAPSNNVKHSVTATRIMEQISKEKKKRNLEEQKKESSSSATSQSSAKKLKIFSHDVTGVRYTAGKASGSLTSTAMEVTSKNAIREASPEEILQAQFQIMKQRKEKGYVRLITNLGDLLVELHCDIAPRTCTNFLGLVEAKKYDGTSFHRLIPNFMVQGGKAKSGSEDASLWGPSFVDEFDDRLKHVDAGVVSMANTGPGTNKRQFFITFKSCSHLNRKHSIFGQVVDDTNGVLKKIEKQPVDTKDRPLETVKIITAEILVDPAQDALELQHEQMEEREKKRQEEETRKQAMAVGKSGVVKNKISTSTSNNKTNSRVGKYLPKSAVQSKIVDGDQNNERDTSMPMILPAAKPKAPPPTKTKFGDFSGW